jgi:biopolymer transport protein ExbB
MIVHTQFKVLARTWALAIGLAVASVAGVSTSAMAQTPAPVAAPAATTAVAADPAAAAKKPEAAAENPYGIAALWSGSDGVAKGVLLILAIMSMGSWYILAVKMLEQRKAGAYAREAAEKFWGAGTVAQGAAALDKDSPYQFIAAAGVDATKKHGGLMGHIPLNDWISMSIQRSVDRVNRELQGGLAFLATVGSTAPFVGLFGTVWGIYHALTAIGMAGQASHRQGGRPGGRGADHDRHRPGRGRARGDGLQLADPPQQDGDGRRSAPSAATCTTCCWPAKALSHGHGMNVGSPDDDGEDR